MTLNSSPKKPAHFFIDLRQNLWENAGSRLLFLLPDHGPLARRRRAHTGMHDAVFALWYEEVFKKR